MIPVLAILGRVLAATLAIKVAAWLVLGLFNHGGTDSDTVFEPAMLSNKCFHAKFEKLHV